MSKHRAKKMLPFQTGKLSVLWYVRNRAISSTHRSNHCWKLLLLGLLYWIFSPSFIVLPPPCQAARACQKLATIDFSSHRMGSTSFHAKYDFAVFQQLLPLIYWDLIQTTVLVTE